MHSSIRSRHLAARIALAEETAKAVLRFAYRLLYGSAPTVQDTNGEKYLQRYATENQPPICRRMKRRALRGQG